MKRDYYRHLPHQTPEGAPVFLTWNLKGAIPKAVAERLRHQRDSLAREPRRPDETVQQRSIRHGKLGFRQSDEFLDASNTGPLLLREPAAAQIVEDTILECSSGQFTLWAWCIMANHVHVLLTPHDELAAITQKLKGRTSLEINRFDDEVGRTVWQDESYDHWARDEEEMLRIIDYIENNPVKAGLCRAPSDWPWSSARFRTNWPVGAPYVGQALA